MFKSRNALVLALLGALSSGSFAITILDDNFNTGYTAGSLSGQNGYSVQGSTYTYSPTAGRTGGGVTYNSASASANSWAWQDLGYSVTSSNPILTFSVDVSSLGFVSATGTTTSRFGMDIYNGAGARLALFGVTFSGGTTTQAIATILAGGATLANVNITAGFNTWKTLGVVLNTTTNQASFLLDGAVIGTQTYTAADTSVGDVDLQALPSGYDTGVYDNLKFSAAAPVPEPASMAVLGLGAAAMLRRRRA